MLLDLLKRLLGRSAGRDAQATPAALSADAAIDDIVRLQQRGDHAAAETVCRELLRRDAGHAVALHLLGHGLVATGRVAEAVEALVRAAAADAQSPEVRFHLAEAHRLAGNEAAAIDSLRAALRLRPAFPEARVSLGSLCQTAGDYTEAEAQFRAAIDARPDFAQAHYNLGFLLSHVGRHSDAIARYRMAIAIDPDFGFAQENLLYGLNFDPTQTIASITADHRAWGARLAGVARAGGGGIACSRDPARRLRVGYLSPDFRGHSVAYFFEPLLARHDRGQVEAWCLYAGTAADATNARLRGLSDRWIDCAQMTDDELARRIRAEGIDILVDLAGHTRGNRLAVFARRPAPIQVTWLGYPTGTGFDAIDYRLTDGIVDPPDEASPGAETLVRLPHSYYCYRPPVESPPVGALPALAAGHVTFGSFNHTAKCSDATLALWGRLLSRLPGARLKLKSRNLAEEGMRAHFRARLAGVGVAAERVSLVGWEAATANHLAHYDTVDIGLDTWPYNGATTTCEALWMGVPVVTLAGNTHASRMGASILAAAGAADLVTTTPDAYVDRCVALAGDLPQLGTRRDGLRNTLRGSPLMDEAGFARAVEARYRDMWRAWCEGAPAGNTGCGGMPSGAS